MAQVFFLPMRHPYLLFALLLTACYDDSTSEPATGSGDGTSTTTNGSNGSQTSGSASGGANTTASGGTTSSVTSSATTVGGSAGGGQGGAADGGTAGAGGSGADAGAGGEGGAGGECVPAMRALVLAIFGDFECPPLEECVVENCSDELGAAMGDDWSSGDHSGGICADYADCVETCDCGSECSLDCRDEHAGGGDCLDSIIEVSLCRNEACPAAAESCAP